MKHLTSIRQGVLHTGIALRVVLLACGLLATGVVVADKPQPKKPATVSLAKPVKKAMPVVATPIDPAGIVTRVITTDQRAENMYRDAVALMRQDRMTEAQTLLKEGAKLAPQRSEIFMALAHVQVANNDFDAAIATLEGGLPATTQNADFHAFLATLLQQQDRHEESITHYVTALRLTPDTANWLLGLGISLQAQKDVPNATEAYQQAMALGLTPSLMQFAQDRLRQVSR